MTERFKLVNGVEVPLTAEELAQLAADIAEAPNQQWDKVRFERNTLLSACDWTQLPDSPLTNEARTNWAEYRQALRDVTEQADPFAIVWPVQPE